jgi:hypothetical protein
LPSWINMTVACPACGGDVEVAERKLSVLGGACPNCAREVLLLTHGSTAPGSPHLEGTDGGAELSIPHPGDDCDGTITLELAAPDRLVGVCTDCGEELAFVLSTGGEVEEEPEQRREERPRSRAPMQDRGEFRDRGPARDGPPTRPCRQCGGALSFETGEDGTVTGHCASCGNTFTLPRRREGERRYEGGRGGDRGGGGYRGRTGGAGGRYGRDRRPSSEGAPRRYGRRPPARRRDD